MYLLQVNTKNRNYEDDYMYSYPQEGVSWTFYTQEEVEDMVQKLLSIGIRKEYMQVRKVD